MDDARVSVLGHDVLQQIKKARRATWGPTDGGMPTISTTNATSLDESATVARLRSVGKGSIYRSAAANHERPAMARLASTPEESTVRRSNSQQQQQQQQPKLSKRHTVVGPMDKRKSFASAGTLKVPLCMANVRRWDARSRRATAWDGLQRDLELYSPSGELLVHLHEQGHSRRGPSFRVSLSRVHRMQCGPMFTLCHADETTDSRARQMPGAPRIYEMFIPPPEGSLREEAFTWHLTTRNFFAFILGKPLVAAHLGQALVDLQERLYLFRADEADNRGDLMMFLEECGYLDFGHNPDYALAVLYFAEQYKLRNLWIDAFAHCVGMSNLLVHSEEYTHIRGRTKALITRAYLEMDLHLSRCWKAMSHFLEDELSESNLGLSAGARTHLDRFRSFLHQHYVQKFGYWPPARDLHFPRALYKSMYFDFRNLYEYLVDRSSIASMQTQQPASGGICVLQNLEAFDKRHKYPPLPHTLPLLPTAATHTKLQSQRAIFALKLGSKSSKSSRQYNAHAALHAATNSATPAVVNSSLVKAYRQFERECAEVRKEEKVSTADARKVRWILIYAVLQTLVSITRAPTEVRDTEAPGYPLCCLVAGLPPWDEEPEFLGSTTSLSQSRSVSQTDLALLNSQQTHDSNGMPYFESAMQSQTSFEIHPDCEPDREYPGRHRSDSTVSTTSLLLPGDTLSSSVSQSSAPPRLDRNPSSRSQRTLRTLSFTNLSSRRNSTIKTSQAGFCEIIVHGYGNGLNPTIVDVAPATPVMQPMELEPAPLPVELPASMPGMPNPVYSAANGSAVISNNSSASTIVAPQPLRPMSARERTSISLPTELPALDMTDVSIRDYTPTPLVSPVDASEASDMFTRLTPIQKQTQKTEDNNIAPVAPEKADTPVSGSDTTDSDQDNSSPVWSSRRGSASSQSSAGVSPIEPELVEFPTIGRTMQAETQPNRVHHAAEPEFQDVGGLLSGTGKVGIHVHRTFSVDRQKAATGGSPIAPNVQAVRRARDQAFAAAQKRWKRASLRQ